MKLALMDLIYLMDLIAVIYIISEKLNSLPIKLFEFSFHKDQKEWNQKLILIEIRHNSDRVIVLMIYRKYYALNEKLHVFFGKHDCKYIYRR